MFAHIHTHTHTRILLHIRSSFYFSFGSSSSLLSPSLLISPFLLPSLCPKAFVSCAVNKLLVFKKSVLPHAALQLDGVASLSWKWSSAKNSMNFYNICWTMVFCTWINPSRLPSLSLPLSLSLHLSLHLSLSLFLSLVLHFSLPRSHSFCLSLYLSLLEREKRKKRERGGRGKELESLLLTEQFSHSPP